MCLYLSVVLRAQQRERGGHTHEKRIEGKRTSFGAHTAETLTEFPGKSAKDKLFHALL